MVLHNYIMMSRSVEACSKFDTLSCRACVGVVSANSVLEARHEGSPKLLAVQHSGQAIPVYVKPVYVAGCRNMMMQMATHLLVFAGGDLLQEV